jgi:DNA-binding transcriptional ArsR family regulator
MKTNVFPIRADDELLELISCASKITRLNKSEVTRQSIRLGAAELVRRYKEGKPSLVEYLAEFKGLDIPKRRYPVKRRL